MKKFIERVWGRVSGSGPLGIVLMLASCVSLGGCALAGGWVYPVCGILCWCVTMGAALWMLLGGGGE